MSRPACPWKKLVPVLPVMRLASALPVPATLGGPVKVKIGSPASKFSMFALSAKFTKLRTVSVP